MDIVKLTDGAKGIYIASTSATVTVKGENVRKVVEPYYCKEKRIIREKLKSNIIQEMSWKELLSCLNLSDKENL